MSDTNTDDDLHASDVAAWLIRTYVPMAVVAVLGWIAMHWHLVLDDHVSAQVVAGAVLAALAAYVGAARWLERRRGASWPALLARTLGRWMLGGVLRQPVYIDPGDRVLTADGRVRRPA